MGLFDKLNSLSDTILNGADKLYDKMDSVLYSESIKKKETKFQEENEGDSDEQDELQYTYDGVTMTFKSGETSVDDDQKDDFPEDVQCIVFPSSFKDLYEDDFPNCMSNLKKLDFTQAYKLKYISDDCFHDCDNLRVVVLPPNCETMPKFENCERLVEIHAPASLDSLYPVTGDEDNRIIAYLSNPNIAFDEDFCKDCEKVYVHKSVLREWREEAKEEDLDVTICPLPAGYSFPKVALTEPWTPEQSSVQPTASATPTKPTVAPAPAPSAPSSCPPPMPKFEFHAIIEGQQRGPYDHTQFKRLVDAGLVTAQTMVWSQGISGWEKAGNVDVLTEFFPKTSQMMPPPPPIG